MTATAPTPRVFRGFYRHYKGPIYFVTGVGVLHDESRRIVVYESTQSVIDGEPRLRYEDDFDAWVNPATGERDVGDVPMLTTSVRRFVRVES